ncbi:MAG: hypothetical protein JWQ30_814, partial [Sediminibacterium sp.]|nr:hypothetical protein [Sediminibacterium sp.]
EFADVTITGKRIYIVTIWIGGNCM